MLPPVVRADAAAVVGASGAGRWCRRVGPRGERRRRRHARRATAPSTATAPDSGALGRVGRRAGRRHRVRSRLGRRARSRPASPARSGSAAGSSSSAAAAAAAWPTTPASRIVAATAPTTSAVFLLSCGATPAGVGASVGFAGPRPAPARRAPARRVVDPVAGPGHLAAGADRRTAGDAEVRAGQQRHLARGAVRRPVRGVLELAAGRRRLQGGLEHREVQQVAQPDHQHGRDQRAPHEADDGTRGALEPGGEEQPALEDDVGEQRLGRGRGSRPA